MALLARVLGWTASVFYQVEKTGGPLPTGPVLVTANHPNALLDPLLIFHTAGRSARPLAKAPLFQQVVVGTMLRALGGLPVYRRQDDQAQMHRNDETFRRAVDALHQGDAVQIFPEGRSHSHPGLIELKTGAARIALAAESQSDWRLRLSIVPVGITYRRKSLFRGRALVTVGAPYSIADLRDLYERDAQECVRRLTDRIAERIQVVTLHLTQAEDQELLEVAETLYVRAKGVRGPRQRDDLHERMPRLRQFAEGLAWLRAHDPARYGRLARAVRRYARIVRLLGVREGDVPHRYHPGSVLLYALRAAAYLLIGAVPALLGTAFWYVPYVLPRLVVSRLQLEIESIATWKLALGFFVFPLALVAYTFLAWKFAGGLAGVAVAIALPLLGFVALAWRERWDYVREDARLFLRALSRRRIRLRLARDRQWLMHEFDAIQRERIDAGQAP
jgi:glycerol-3-phosphate O-acyltransferase / dihydroxyacetone phosphate acyltransferase